MFVFKTWLRSKSIVRRVSIRTAHHCSNLRSPRSSYVNLSFIRGTLPGSCSFHIRTPGERTSPGASERRPPLLMPSDNHDQTPQKLVPTPHKSEVDYDAALREPMRFLQLIIHSTPLDDARVVHWPRRTDEHEITAPICTNTNKFMT